MYPRDELTKVPTRAEAIAGQLMRKILDGEFPPETKLPSERDLASAFDATRNVVREALKRLEALGLVRVRRGSGVYVENPQLSAGIELFDALMTHEDGTLNAGFLRDALEFRGFIVRLIVRLAAARRTEEELERIRALVAKRESCREDAAQLGETSLQLFHEIANATHNRICQLLFNTVARASMRLRTIADLPVLGHEQGQRVLERLVDAFEARDDALAELIAIRYVEAVEQAMSLPKHPSVFSYIDSGTVSSRP